MTVSWKTHQKRSVGDEIWLASGGLASNVHQYEKLVDLRSVHLAVDGATLLISVTAASTRGNAPAVPTMQWMSNTFAQLNY